MELISDILLIAGALGAGFYCIVLSRRLSRFTNLEKGMGGAIAVLSAQVDDMTTMLSRAQGTAIGSTTTLECLTERAEEVARRLELLVASMHDLPDARAAVADHAEFAKQSVPPEDPQAVESRFAPRSVPTPKPQPTQIETEPASLFRSTRPWSQEAAE